VEGCRLFRIGCLGGCRIEVFITVVFGIIAVVFVSFKCCKVVRGFAIVEILIHLAQFLVYLFLVNISPLVIFTYKANFFTSHLNFLITVTFFIHPFTFFIYPVTFFISLFISLFKVGIAISKVGIISQF